MTANIIHDQPVNNDKAIAIDYELLYRQYSKTLFNASYRIVNNRADAEDILQDAFTHAFKKMHTLEDSRSFGAWIKKIVINKSINKITRSRFKFIDINVSNLYSIADEELYPEEDIEFKVDEIKKAIQLLPDGYRTILCLRLMENYKHDEIAEMLKISPVTARTQYSRAKRKLLEILQHKNVS